MCQNIRNLHVSPCLHCHPHSYIRMVRTLFPPSVRTPVETRVIEGPKAQPLMTLVSISEDCSWKLDDLVQSLIERCLMLRMDREECIRALALHAQIRPQVTLTVWRELLKENKDFFQSYFQAISSPKDT